MRSLAFTRLLTLMMVMMMVVVGCQPQPAQPTNEVLDLELERLLVDQTLFPLSWYVESPPRPWGWKDSGGAEATAAVNFRQSGSRARATHMLFRYRDIESAAAQYHLLPWVFYSADRLTPWESPEGLSYQSLTADQFRFGCAEIGLSVTDPNRFATCHVAGQYGKYLSIFTVWVVLNGTSGMSLEDLQPILQALDERMSSQAASSR